MATSKSAIALITIFFISIILFWLLHLDRIGLHGDESWFGLQAWEYLHHGIEKPYGMNRYSGILQSLANAFVFKYFGIGIVQLRITGVAFNIVAILLLSYGLYKKVGYKATVFFLLLFAQSAFFLVELKVAWEVCSFNLFFLSLSLISILKLWKDEERYFSFWAFVFLLSSLLGAYNHIIFSSLPLSLLAGLFLWKFLNKTNVDGGIKIICVLTLSIINIVFLFLFMHFWIDIFWTKIQFLCFLVPVALIIIELLFWDKILLWGKHILNPIFILTVSKRTITGILVVSALLFLMFHGVLLFQILSQQVMFFRVFSYALPNWMAFLLIVSAVLILLYLGYCLITDIKNNPSQPLAFILIAYLGLFNLYNNGSSIRYLIIFVALAFIYLAIKLAVQNGLFRNTVITALVLNMLLVQPQLWVLITEQHRAVRAISFKIGGGAIETSAHFLSFDPVLNYIDANKIGQIETSEKFFIGNAFKFYKLIYPQINGYKNVGGIEYERDSLGDGFKKTLLIKSDINK